ncbi:MAG: DUF3829 domain-containing protein [Sandaracinaceae bacterium]|nr:DUF3829 domain-containing protein [Sandaracinaceae bacterium]
MSVPLAEQIERELESYDVGCFYFGSFARAAWQDYELSAPRDLGPGMTALRRPGQAFAPFRLPIRFCREAAERGRASPSLAAAEALAERYAAAVEALDPLLRDADGYYERFAFERDGYAHGRELHPRLVGAFDEVASVDAALRALIEPVQDVARAARVARLSTDAAEHESFFVEHAMLRARIVVRQVLALRTIDRVYVSDFPGRFFADVLELEQAADALFAHDTGPWDDFQRALQAMVRAARACMRKVRDREPVAVVDEMHWSSGENPCPTRRCVALHHNELVDAYVVHHYRWRVTPVTVPPPTAGPPRATRSL